MLGVMQEELHRRDREYAEGLERNRRVLDLMRQNGLQVEVFKYWDGQPAFEVPPLWVDVAGAMLCFLPEGVS